MVPKQVKLVYEKVKESNFSAIRKKLKPITDQSKFDDPANDFHLLIYK